MTFEEALQRVALTYFERGPDNLSVSDVMSICGEHLHVDEVRFKEGIHIAHLPNSIVDHSESGVEDCGEALNHWLFTFDKGIQLSFLKKPLSFSPGHRSVFGEAYVEVSFNPALRIPNNSSKDSGFRLPYVDIVGNPSAPPITSSERERLTEMQFVYDTNLGMDGLRHINCSPQGRMVLPESVESCGYRGAVKFIRAGVKPSHSSSFLPCYIGYCPGEEDSVARLRHLSLRHVLNGERVHEYLSQHAALGDDSLTALFNHMQYEAEIEKLVK